MEFTDEQQAYIDKLVGQARQEGRKSGSEKAKQELAEKERKELEASLEESQEWKRLAKERADKIAELEPLSEKLEAYQGVVEGLLKSKVEELDAEKVVKALPEQMTDLEKLNWLTENAELFGGGASDPGTPRRPPRKQGGSPTPERRRRVSL